MKWTVADGCRVTALRMMAKVVVNEGTKAKVHQVEATWRSS